MKRIILSLTTLFALGTVSAQEVALKTNLLALPFSSLNLGAEFSVAPKWTIATDITLPIFNIWGDYPYVQSAPNTNSDFYANGWLGYVEGRYWFCEAFNKHHLGVYLGGARVGHMKVDNSLFGTMLSGLYKGQIGDARVGMLGVSYGYYIKFFHGWGLDLYLGVGAIYAKYLPTAIATTEYDSFFSFNLSKIGASLSYKF